MFYREICILQMIFIYQLLIVTMTYGNGYERKSENEETKYMVEIIAFSFQIKILHFFLQRNSMLLFTFFFEI